MASMKAFSSIRICGSSCSLSRSLSTCLMRFIDLRTLVMRVMSGMRSCRPWYIARSACSRVLSFNNTYLQCGAFGNVTAS